jgi:hypothetical protein
VEELSEAVNVELVFRRAQETAQALYSRRSVIVRAVAALQVTMQQPAGTGAREGPTGQGFGRRILQGR